MPADASPRPLDAAERRILDGLLSVDFPGVVELRAQRTSVLAQRTCSCGCASIDLVVDPSTPLASVTDTVPVSAQAWLPAPVGRVTILLFVHRGRLSLMEIASYGDHAPDRWPVPGTLVIEEHSGT